MKPQNQQGLLGNTTTFEGGEEAGASERSIQLLKLDHALLLLKMLP